MDSPPNNQPNNTATKGFTYAYVDAWLGGTTRINQLYYVYPTQEPKTIKYPKAQKDLPEILST